MQNMLNTAAEHLPQFNDYLISRFRPEKLDGMVQYLDKHLSNMVRVLSGVEYMGYRELTPLEAATWRINESTDKKKVKVNWSSSRVIQYAFRMDDRDYHMYVQLPYMDESEGAIIYNDTRYYPMFILAERLVRPFKGYITIKLAQAALKFYRSQKHTVKTTDGQVIKEFNITARIHHGTSSKEPPPLILYHLCQFGYKETLKKYGISPDDMQVVDNSEKAQEGYVYFQLPEEKFLKVADRLIQQKQDRGDLKNNQRIIIGLLKCLKVWPRYNISDVYSPDTGLWFIILGKYIRKAGTDPGNLIKYARDHWMMYKVFLDPTTQENFRKAGFPCEDEADLLFHVFRNIDQWLIEEPSNLYGKVIGLMELTIAPFINKLSRELYSIVDPKKKREIQPEDVKKFVNRTSSENPLWFSSVCRANPDMIHDNWLVQIGLKSRREFKNESSSNKKGTTMEMLISHPSWLTTESILNLPSQSPVLAGEVNPFLQIDDDGVIQKPEFADEIRDIFA